MPEEHVEDELDETPEYIEEYVEEYASVSSIVKEALPFTSLYTLGGVAAGLILGSMTTEIALIPGLLVIVPAVMGMRGNISCTLGSRLGSAIHMGLITKIERNPELINNITASWTLSLIIAVMLGLLGHYISLLLGLPVPPQGPIIFISIAVVAGMISGIILSGMAVLLAIAMFRFEIDPDNVVTPALGTMGDVITMLAILLGARMVMLWPFTL